jgi:serine/threonine-protein kinase
VLDQGTDTDDVPYLVMDLLEGETYEARLARKGPLPVAEVLWIADRTLAVLSAAHAKGIVHRDVKPENLFLTKERKLKVLDFGIARLGEKSTTRVGTVLGTLAFMPPEQARGATSEIGLQSDLWSVGATMFTLLSGRLVREAADLEKLLREAGQSSVPKLAEVAPGVPEELADLVDNALLLKVEVRWRSATLMRRALRIVAARIKRPTLRRRVRQDEDEEEEEISAPSFDAVPGEDIEPPPASVVAQPHVPPVTRQPDVPSVARAPAPVRPPEVRRDRVPWLALAAVVVAALVLATLLLWR